MIFFKEKKKVQTIYSNGKFSQPELQRKFEKFLPNDGNIHFKGLKVSIIKEVFGPKTNYNPSYEVQH